MDSPEVEEIQVDTRVPLSQRAPIPENIRKHLLPPKTLSISNLLSFPLWVSTSTLTSSLAVNFSTDIHHAQAILPTLHMPTYFDYIALCAEAQDALDIELQSFIYCGPTTVSEKEVSIVLPIWVLNFWEEIQSAREAQKMWKTGTEWLSERIGSSVMPYYDLASNLMGNIPWNATLTKEWGGGPVTSLSRFCGHHWLNDENMIQLGNLLTLELRAKDDHRKQIQTSWWSSLLIQQMRELSQEQYGMSRRTASQRGAGKALFYDELDQLAFPVHVELTERGVTLPKSGTRGKPGGSTTGSGSLVQEDDTDEPSNDFTLSFD
ncbi:hypothetical protein BDP27DRAFT_1438866 [Rhodocollybia butyracea]|uniref:Uncharacterized protein n=1 Tax=Rhodocollybia butyracea TaxID=206335 RepID=A0A9P5P3L2_9AGAR|nr:hypothetical protein BDP27DRAFT_1438866 [Rhodocollybia butyracea]